MKFSVVPESSSAEALALLNKEFRYTRIVIDRRFDRYTLLVLNALTKAELVRCPENPLPRPLLSLPQSGPLLGCAGRGTWLRVLLPSHHVTAAYATITSRLGVVMTRLLAAAFWLGVGE
jgi:hypothetical protein